MKKILMIMLVFMSLFYCSCKSNDNSKTNYDFGDKNDLMKDLTIYEVKINNNGTTIEVFENTDYLYFLSTNSSSKVELFFEKNGNKIYELNDTKEEKEVVDTSEITVNKVYDILITFFGLHFSISSKDYKLLDQTEEVINTECQIYQYIKEGSKRNLKDSYYVDKKSGRCLKHVQEYDENGVITTAKQEVEVFSFDENKINEKLSKYANYTSVKVSSSWPNSPLANRIPKLNNGKFVMAVDKDLSCDIVINNLSATNFDNYILEFDAKTFKNEFNTVTIARHNIYVFSTADNVLVYLEYVSGQLTIKINQYTEEEIASAIKKIKDANTK